MKLPNTHDMKSITSANLAILAHDALEELDRRTDEEKGRRWNKLVEEMQAYINDYGFITINIDGEETFLGLDDDFSYRNTIIVKTEDE